MYEKFPKCEFLGVDPDEGNKEIYEKKLNGKFVRGLLAAKTGVKMANVLRG